MERVGAVVGGSSPDVEPAQSDVPVAGPGDARTPSGRRPLRLRRNRAPQAETPASGAPRKRRRNPGSAVFGGLRRLWIPLVILIVVVAGAFAVTRLHGIFGSEKDLGYGDTKSDESKPFNPKHLRYEIFGAPGTKAQISYFDENGDPQYLDGESLPWSVEFPITTATGVGSIAAQGDSDTIGCRILIDDQVKSEKIVNQVSAFTSCLLKAA